MDIFTSSKANTQLFLLYGATAFSCTLFLLMLTSPPAVISQIAALGWIQIQLALTSLESVLIWTLSAEHLHLPVGMFAIGLFSAWLSHRWTLRVLTQRYELNPITRSDLSHSITQNPLQGKSTLTAKPNATSAEAVTTTKEKVSIKLAPDRQIKTNSKQPTHFPRSNLTTGQFYNFNNQPPEETHERKRQSILQYLKAG